MIKLCEILENSFIFPIVGDNKLENILILNDIHRYELNNSRMVENEKLIHLFLGRRKEK